MEISSSALTGALRVGVQVVVGRKRPVLEIYQQLHNTFDPPFEIDQKDSAGKTVRVDKHRFQNIFIDLTLINIGGDRAEGVTFEVSGEFRREEPRQELPELFGATIGQVAPGQTLYLMRIDSHDLNIYAPEKPGDTTAFKAVGIKKDTLEITMHYDGPDTILNKLLRWPRRWRGLRQYSSTFIFNPSIFIGDLPPPRYQ
ncbi:hypothetical protein [Stappia sp. ES.058]|uniref:hypothetical protein n=1 Tax=Stappia sp. ES.058 TaxID=1881061 RepID=UPI0008799CA7|nr:hypothetical protein [Stappia sp. ES.058]SDU42345.1 hypothetical protein SAMN05428979_3686 [Stappia sp. ES.058]